MKEAVEQGPVIQKIAAEFLWNSEDTVAMYARNKLAGHRKGTMEVIHVSAGGAETTFAVESDIFKVTTKRAAPEDTAIGGVTAVNHLIDIFNH